MAGTLGREVISTRQRKIAELARREPKMTLTTLAHHIDEVWMREAYRRTRKDAAAGVDGVTAAQYEADLEANLSGLLERFKSGRYRAPAVRRVHLEKPGTSKTRPIGIPTLEDKILQRAVLMVLEPVYEQDFVDCSYGFRPGRGAQPSAASSVGRADEARRWLGDRPGHRRLFRQHGLGSPEELSGPTGARRSDTTSDREVVERRSDGGGQVELSATGSPTRGRAFPDAFERLSA